MKKGKHNLENSSNKKAYLYKSKYFLVFIILIIMALLMRNIYTIQSSIEIGKVSLEEYDLLAGTTEVTQGKVIVKYKDTQGTEIEESTVLVGNIGEIYETQRKEISSYKTYGYDPINKIGNFDSQDTEVTYVYEKENDDVNIINENNVITVQVIKGQQEEYEEIGFSIITKSATGDIIKGAKYMVTDINSAVIRNATSYSDKLIVGSLTVAEAGKDSYFIKELSAPEGYKAISDTVEIGVVKTLNAETNEIDVSLEFGDYENVEIKMENGEIVVVVVNEEVVEPENPPVEPEDPPVEPENPPVEPEDPPVEPEEPPVEPEDPPVDPEDPPVGPEDPPVEPEVPPVEESKKFDLQIKKYITEVKVKTGNKVITKTKEKDSNDIMKIEVPKNKIDKTQLEVTYAIEVENVGEIEGYAKEIVDLIPQGMRLKANSNWKQVDNLAKTDILADVLIRPGDNAVVYITLEWDLSEENVGVKTNKVTITQYYNELNAEDETPDNYNEEKLLVATKTGEIWTWAPQALGILVLGVCVVVILKKFGGKKEE